MECPSSGLVRDALQRKHPLPGTIDPSAFLLKEVLPLNHDTHTAIFNRINTDLIRHMGIKCQGAAGPSGVDSDAWRHLSSSFKKASSSLCHSLALVTHHLCSSYVHPDGLASFMACRLIALDKSPGVRPASPLR